MTKDWTMANVLLSWKHLSRRDSFLSAFSQLMVPEHWQSVSLGDLGSWHGGSTPSKGNVGNWAGGTISWVSPKDFKSALITDSLDKITHNAMVESNLRLQPAGSLLFVARSGILKRYVPVAINTLPVTTNQDIRTLTLYPGVNALLLLWQLLARQGELLQATVKEGTTVESLDSTALKSFKVLLPPRLEQEALANRITALLTKVSGLGASLTKIEQRSREYQTFVTRQALRGELTKDWKTKHNAGESQTTTLGAIADIQGGLTLGKKLRAEQPLTRPYLRVANVQRGLLDLTNVKQVRVSEVDADKYSLVVGDVLMNEGGDRDKLGRGWIWNDEIQGCLYQNHVYRVRLRDRKFPPAFISMYANELGSEYFMSVATQTTNLASINKRSLSAFPMIIPTAAEASEALKIIRKCRDQVSRLQSVIQESEASLGQLERRIFVAAFRGELVSRVAGDDTVDLTVNEPLRRRTATMTKKIRPGLDDVHRSTDTWPVGGLSFQELMSGTAGGYEVVKDAIFAKLSGPEPELEQRYSEADGVMRFYRRAR